MLLRNLHGGMACFGQVLDCAHEVKTSFGLGGNIKPPYKPQAVWVGYSTVTHICGASACYQSHKHLQYVHSVMSASPWTSWITDSGQLVSRKNESAMVSLDREAEIMTEEESGKKKSPSGEKVIVKKEHGNSTEIIFLRFLRCSLFCFSQ